MRKNRFQLKLCSSMATMSLIALMSLLAYASAATADEFESELERIDCALADNPNHVVAHALDTCANRSHFAAQLYYFGQVVRETLAVLDFVSRLAAPEECRASAEWRNPDFE